MVDIILNVGYCNSRYITITSENVIIDGNMISHERFLNMDDVLFGGDVDNGTSFVMYNDTLQIDWRPIIIDIIKSFY